MATDIAFAVGVLMLLGKRVPSTLRVLLLAFAIIDDIGAILVIAIFYSSGLALDGLVVAGGGLAFAFLLTRLGVRPGLVFAVPLLVIWAGLYRAGIHPTLAGVLLGLLMPVRPWFGAEGFMRTAQGAMLEFQERARLGRHDKELLEPLNQISEAQREAISPVVRGEAALHPWVAYGVMPLFALANAGVTLGGLALDSAGGWTVLAGVTLGLLVGKPVGVLCFAWLSVRLGFSALPPGVSWRGIAVVGLAGGIGFTMAIFIAELAFADPALLNLAKLGVLVATAVAAAGALTLGRIVWATEQPAEIASITDSSAEATPALWSGDYQAADAGETTRVE
jgi:NhaA family Na+:H+ antiporter